MAFLRFRHMLCSDLTDNPELSVAVLLPVLDQLSDTLTNLKAINDPQADADAPEDAS